jgi:DNA modification methylase
MEIKVYCAFDEMVPTADLKEHPKNPNKHPQRQIKILSEIIKRQGWRAPVTVSNLSGLIVRGHGRLLAARHLGLDKIPVDYQDYVSEDAEIADLIADKKIAEFSELDKDIFGKLLKDLDEDWLEATGFTENELENLRPIDQDDVPEKPKQPISKTGEIYQLGKHRLLCGDATNPEDIARLMNGAKAEMLFTDPPYNVDYGKNKDRPTFKIRPIIGDKQDAQSWLEFNRTWMTLAREHVLGDWYVWGASDPEGMRQRLLAVEMGLHWSATIIWAKDRLVLTPANYQRKYEMCLYGWFGKSSWQGDRKETELWECKRPGNSKEHPTMKPLEICARGIINSSAPGSIVLDLFGGSGSTLIAAEQTGRACYISEIDPGYCDVIRQRYRNFMPEF